MIKNVKIGQNVLFFGEKFKINEKGAMRSYIYRGVVSDIRQETLGVNPLRVHTTVTIECPKLPERFVQKPISQIYSSYNEIHRMVKVNNGEIDIRDDYRNEIKSIKDLMVFIFSHDMEMRENNPARTVAFEKAQELLGMDLNGLIGAIEI